MKTLAPAPRRTGFKRQITHAEYLSLGGKTNPKLFIVVKNGKLTYWMNE